MSLAGVSRESKDIPKWCGAGTTMIAIAPDAREYPCHLFMEGSNRGERTEKDIGSILVNWTDAGCLLEESCRECPIASMCPNCYGMNYALTGDPRKREMSLCLLSKVRALANSYMQGKMLASAQNYAFFDGRPEPEIRATIAGINTVQFAFR